MSIQIEEKPLDRITLLSLRGQVALGDGTDQLQEKMKDLVRDGRNRLILNLAEMDYIDSSGLAVLVSCLRDAWGKGEDVKLLHPSKRVKHILKITRLNTVEQAFEALNRAQISFRKKREL